MTAAFLPRTLLGLAGSRSERRWLAVDVGVAALLLPALLSFMAMSRNVTHAGGLDGAVRMAALLCAVAPVPVRRLFPRRAFVAATVSAGVATALGGPPQVAACVAIAAYSAASAGDFTRRWLPPAAAGGVLSAGVAVGHAPGWLPALIAAAAVISVGWFAGEAARERRQRQAAAAERRAEQERQRAARLRQAAADERLVIARELHDIVAHAMSVIAVRAGVAGVVMDSDPAQVKEALSIIETTTRRALQEMRLLVGILRRDDSDTGLDPAPGMADIAALVGQIGRAGVDVGLDMLGPPRPLPAGVDLSAYRIAQEALTNVVRHAGPTQARLRIEYHPEQLVIEVTDVGPALGAGPRPDETGASSGHGLIGMRERAALFGGHLTAGPSGPGFRLRAQLRTDEAAG